MTTDGSNEHLANWWRTVTSDGLKDLELVIKEKPLWPRAHPGEEHPCDKKWHNYGPLLLFVLPERKRRERREGGEDK